MLRALIVSGLLLVAALGATQQLFVTLGLSTKEPSTYSLAAYPRLSGSELKRLRAFFEEGKSKNAAFVPGAVATVFTAEPLADYPLAAAGFEFARQGDVARASVAIRAAHKRNPRNLAALGWLAVADAREGRFEAAIAKIETLLRLNPDGRERYVAALVELAADRRAWGPLQGAIDRAPNWGDSFARQLSKTQPGSPIMLAALARVPSAQEAYLRDLTEKGRTDEAFMAWLRFVPGGLSEVQWPYNPQFGRKPGAAPFNWSIDPLNAELLETGGLYVNFVGRRPLMAARQTLLLGPGSYTFTAQMQGDARPRGGFFRWDIACAEGGEPIMSVDITPLSDDWTAWRGRFEIPFDACTSQIIVLKGVPGELPLRARAQTRLVRIDSAASKTTETTAALSALKPQKTGAPGQVPGGTRSNAH